MFASIRSTLLVCAALSASSVAPAQVGAASEPMIATLASIPTDMSRQPLDLPAIDAPAAGAAIETDPLAPLAVEPGAETPTVSESPPPVVKPSGDLASMVAQMRSSTPGSRELECLAVGIYFEAKSEPLIGQLAVGEVIANRANSKGRFPSSYCGVLFQRSQFSFVRGRSWPAVARAGKQWQTAVAIARIVDQDLKDSAADKALFFHARRVSPGWKLKRVATIGNHIFYR